MCSGPSASPSLLSRWIGPFLCPLARELAQIVPAVEAGVVAVVEHEFDCVVADRLDVDDNDVLLAGDDPLLARRMALDLGAWAFDAQALGGQADGFAVVEHDLERPPLVRHGDVGRPSNARPPVRRCGS